MKRITVILADDHTVVREGVRRLLELEADLEVIGEAQDGRQAVALAEKLRPDVVIMDIAMPLLNGLEATRQILKANPAARILMMSSHIEVAYIKDAMESGAAGFLLKHASSHDLSRGIREVNLGHKFFGPSIAKLLPKRRRKSLDQARELQPRHTGLTSRETEVLQLIAEGNGNSKAALELGIGVKTVEKHREHLMQKLHIHDIAGLTRYAISARIIESSVQLTII